LLPLNDFPLFIEEGFPSEPCALALEAFKMMHNAAMLRFLVAAQAEFVDDFRPIALLLFLHD